MRLPLITQHAVERARQRWGLPTATAAEACIREALRRGRWSRWPWRDAAQVWHGQHCCVVKDNRVLTVYTDATHPWRAVRPLSAAGGRVRGRSVGSVHVAPALEKRRGGP